MAPSNLQGLNVVHAAPAAGRDYASDSQNLLDFPTYRDYSTELDLWTNLAFESDEPLHRKRETKGAQRTSSDDGADEDDEAAAKESDMLYPGDSHENIVTGIPLPPRNVPSTSRAPVPPPSLDLANFLTSFGIDPFGIQAQQLQQNASNMPTLAQIFAASPGAAAAAHSANFAPVDKTSPPASKRARTTKTSITSVTPEPESPGDFNNSTPTNAAEDKRRRNTAASARFRLKKKEREAALEKKSKELETKVNELEKECEGLRRENGWLKGLVVGVTGGVAPQQSGVKVGSKRGREANDLDR